jgi:hypothetical protein
MKNCKKKIKTIEQPLLGMLYHFFLFSFLIIFHFPFYHEMNEFFIIIVQLLYMLWNGIEKKIRSTLDIVNRTKESKYLLFCYLKKKRSKNRSSTIFSY